jgi:hypothetical protein
VRPELSQVSFLRAVPLLTEYARANRDNSDLPPGFLEQMEACPLSLRDMLHLGYAICLGYAEARSATLDCLPVLDWPIPDSAVELRSPDEDDGQDTTLFEVDLADGDEEPGSGGADGSEPPYDM